MTLMADEPLFLPRMDHFDIAQADGLWHGSASWGIAVVGSMTPSGLLRVETYCHEK